MGKGAAIVITSGKGGTGKTSVTAGVASCLAAMGYRTLCLDADIGLRNLDLCMGVSDRAVMDFTDVMAGHCSLREAAVAQGRIQNLWLLSAPVRVAAEKVEAEAMKGLLEQIRAAYDFCLVDSPAGLGAGFRLAAAFADRAVLVATNDASSLRDGQRTAQELRAMGISNIRLVMNRVRPKLLRRLGSTIDDAMDSTGLPLLGVVPEDENVLLFSNRGEPIILGEERGAAAAYLNIARRITGQRVPLLRIK